jgi:phosphinothricin acetyltransferase
MEFQLKPCTEKQLPEILEIFNEAILTSTALYDYKLRTLEFMKVWYSDKMTHNFPIIGAFDNQGELLGFSTFGTFRPHSGYKYTVEHSVYVRSDKRGLGLGRILLKEIIKQAEKLNFHALVGVIDGLNIASVRLHENEGFVFAGILKDAGFKFGKWLDVVFYQLILKTPENPIEL